MLPRLKVLFLCTGNSCRSQMAEGWARHLKGDLIEPYSAGIEKHGMNPHAVKVMGEAGVDLSRHFSKTLEEIGPVQFDYVVTEKEAEEFFARKAVSFMGLLREAGMKVVNSTLSSNFVRPDEANKAQFVVPELLQEDATPEIPLNDTLWDLLEYWRMN